MSNFIYGPCSIYIDCSDTIKQASMDMYEALKKLESWWRLPNSERTIKSIEPVICDALDALAKAEKGDR